MDEIIELGMKNIVDVIKIFWICICTYYMNFKLTNRKLNINLKKIIIILVDMIIIAMICRFIKITIGFLYNVIFMILLISTIFKLVTNQKFTYSLLITIISSGINYAIFSLSVIISAIPSKLFNIQNIYAGLILIMVIYLTVICIFCRIKRLQKGLIFLKTGIRNDTIDILILNGSIVILFCITILSSYNKFRSNAFGITFIVISILMFITIQKSLQLYYKQKLQERETEKIKEELESKNKEIEELEKENLKLNKKNHSIAHKQKSLEYEIKQMLLENKIKDQKAIKNKVEKISKQIGKEVLNVELAKTKINEIDNMLKYMQSECTKNKIDFDLQINGNIRHMINTCIAKEELEILLADHIKNAIIAIKHSENINKSILVRLGLIDGTYSLYIYDSGIEFTIETLINLGIKPSTTHKDEGGTGMGFMNTFDTLKKYKASIMIHEYGKPSKDNFTKLIKISFDNRNAYKISSYREQDIQKVNIQKRVSY